MNSRILRAPSLLLLVCCCLAAAAPGQETETPPAEPGTPTEHAPDAVPEPESAPPDFSLDVFTATGEEARGRVLVPVFINGEGPYPFLLDLGIRQPVISREAADYLGLPRVSASVAPAPEAVSVSSFSCGGMAPREDILVSMDLSPLSQRLGSRVAGLLPAHLPGFEVEIDFRKPRVTWRPIMDSVLEPDASGIVPLTLGESGVPSVPARLLDLPERTLALDITEGGGLALAKKFLSDAGILKPETRRLTTPGGDGIVQTQIRLPCFTLADAAFKNLRCTVVTAESEEQIGLEVLRRFVLTLNYEFGLARFVLVEGAERSDAPLAGFGMTLGRQRGPRWTINVAEGGPAQRAGIRNGDLLLELGGMRAIGVPFAPMAEQLTAETGTILKVTVITPALRQQPRTVSLTAEPLL